jgi:predicted RNA-binding Zn-ribbon protein involved in translation (DUF1610 family)
MHIITVWKDSKNLCPKCGTPLQRIDRNKSDRIILDQFHCEKCGTWALESVIKTKTVTTDLDTPAGYPMATPPPGGWPKVADPTVDRSEDWKKE